VTRPAFAPSALPHGAHTHHPGGLIHHTRPFDTVSPSALTQDPTAGGVSGYSEIHAQAAGDTLPLSLKTTDFGKAKAPNVKDAVFKPAEQKLANDALQKIRTDPKTVDAELKSIVMSWNGPAGTMALVWRDNKGNLKWSTEGSTFDPTTDRLELAIAKIDNKKEKQFLGKEGPGTDADQKAQQWDPVKAKPGYQAGHGIGKSLGGSGTLSQGNIAPEPGSLNRARGGLEGAVKAKTAADPNLTVIVLVVYTYPPGKTQTPTAYSWYAVSDGTLNVQYANNDYKEFK
jgi:hypothetical protein